MKKSIRIAILAIIFMISAMSNVFAAEELPEADTITAEVELMPTTTEVKVGDTVTISIIAKCSKGVEGIDSILDWDKTKLNVSVQTKNYYASFSDTDGETGKFVLSALYGESGAPEEAPQEVEFVTLTVNVLDLAEVGEELSIKLSNIEVIDSDVESHTADDQEVILTVVEEQEPAGGESPNPGQDSEPEPEPEPDPEPDPEPQPNPGETDGGKDKTTADKNFNQAGLERHAFVLLLAAIGVILLYSQYRKYRDII